MVTGATRCYKDALAAWDGAGAGTLYSDGLVGEVRARLQRLNAFAY